MKLDFETRDELNTLVEAYSDDPETLAQLAYQTGYTALRQQCAAMAEALRFYANEDNWTEGARPDGSRYRVEYDGTTIIDDDFGETANKALAAWDAFNDGGECES